MNAGSPVEPLPELHEMADRLRALVPDLRGLSVAVLDDVGMTLTLGASAPEIAALDAVQYVGGGPCTEDLPATEVLEVNVDELFGDGRWQLYARACAAAGVGSSLSLPISSGERVTGRLNLYAAGSDAFTGLHEQIAVTVGSDTELVVADADLSYWTAKTAMAAPAKVLAGGDINGALGTISATQGVNIPIARQRLRNAAARAGITEAQAASAIKNLRAG